MTAQFQKFAEREVREVNVDFAQVSEMDAGAAQGIAEGVELAKRISILVGNFFSSNSNFEVDRSRL